MSDVITAVTEFVQEKCRQHKENPKFGYYDYWNDHIKRVLHHAVILADEYGADTEIVMLGALLHDVSMPAEYGDRSEHPTFSAEMTETLLTELSYPKERIELVRKCVKNHSGRNAQLRDTMEELCIADADALAHFDRIPSLFSLAFGVLGMNLEEGRTYVKSRLQGDFDGLSERTKTGFREEFERIMKSLFVED